MVTSWLYNGKKSQNIIAKGLPASPGAAGGKASLL